MFGSLLLFALCGVVGVWLQRGAHGDVVRERVWSINYVLFIPIAATFAFLTVDIDRDLVALLTCSLVAWWLTVLLAGLYARLVAPTRPVRGALWLVAAFPNTGFIGFPLAQLAFGEDGLRLAIIYDQVSLIVPAIVVATIIAQRHATVGDTADSEPLPPVSSSRIMLTSPPLWTVAVLLVLRLTVVQSPLELHALGEVVGAIVGPVGFLLLGLSVPLSGFSHDRREVLDLTGAMLIRIAAAPALVWLVAHLAGVHVPAAMYLIAAMPTAFLTLVISRIYGLEVALVRLGVLVTSVVVIAATVAWVAVG